MDRPVGEAFNQTDTAAESAIRANERQRISRELHNTTSQLTTALQLQIGQLRHQELPAAMPIVAEMDVIIQQIRKSIKEIESRQSRDGHNSDELNNAIAKRFYALRNC